MYQAQKSGVWARLLVVTGPPGAGKSTVARVVAGRLKALGGSSPATPKSTTSPPHHAPEASHVTPPSATVRLSSLCANRLPDGACRVGRPSAGWSDDSSGDQPSNYFVGFRWWIGPQERPSVREPPPLRLVSVPVRGADDGIRTRDPHLGKVAGTGSVTCGDGSIRSMNRAFSFSCNPVGSRRFPVGDGTPTGPLTQSQGYQGTAGRHRTLGSHRGRYRYSTAESHARGATQRRRWEVSFSSLAGGSRRLYERAERIANAKDWRSERSPIGAALSKSPQPQIASLFLRMLEAIRVNQSSPGRRELDFQRQSTRHQLTLHYNYPSGHLPASLRPTTTDC
jgi:energy-coupling factor transporter ATP-binding protein EcfA2